MSHVLQELYALIEPVDLLLRAHANAHLNSLAKPPGSLGRLEALAVRLFCIGGGSIPLRVDPAVVFTVAGDHGVVAEGVNLYPQSVTRQMVRNFLHGGAAISILSQVASAELFVVDAGCAGGPFDGHPQLISVRIGNGTANIAAGPAMSLEDCERAVLAGADIAAKAAGMGCHCIGIGEMGIANSTVAAALCCAYLELAPEHMVGPGAGVPPAGLGHKIRVVRRSLESNANAVASRDPLAVLAALGGFEIAVMTGIMLGAARHKLPFVVDGFIATAAMVAAQHLCPIVSGYCILAHTSAEPGHVAMVQRLHTQTPLLDLRMRLGEGTGSALAIVLLRAAAAIYNDMATLEATVNGQQA
ncbi:MAG: nicotinate-nucleotide--dimethylbenzimidazole phosphoribosyltransferase [Deltaproteobacteria bacterium]|jgi:nicotinate-nucleotide--dimethylbenzimidazole phosphoribosyltransferase|nr:nicotinate-nucleotide--dimethylbenzimidazole phosphoribosyltransferase [Deltaproteobacteria bacterium]